MSRSFYVELTVTKYAYRQRDFIIDALDAEGRDAGGFDNIAAQPDLMLAHSNITLVAGEAIEQFCDRLARAVWCANGNLKGTEDLAVPLVELEYQETTDDSEDDDFKLSLTPLACSAVDYERIMKLPLSEEAMSLSPAPMTAEASL